ncbi:MAG: 50S ribosomal protein L5 [Candidatus Absconditabacteria bacterium]|nr:50S ribosomal protein L5 [Candidatus Absconditabacteria bacterium]MDD3868415.1 50S ribosomal protein L5 [Candidatus Absconditabacteria bacterium]MDD4714061.1 50S ribosomal protein L5 [Candidatus Absconditabacteria bacterium]
MKKAELFQKIKDKLQLTNVNETPKVDKVIVSMGIGSLVTRKGHKDFEEFEKNLKIITGQKPRLCISKKSISNFKLREGMPVMLQVTLRKERAADFLERVAKLVLPRIRDFSGISRKNFDHGGNLNFGITNYALFPEFGVDAVSIPMGIQITVVTSAGSPEKSQAFLEELGFIFK